MSPRKPAKSLDTFVAERDTARFAENQEIARANRTLRTTVAEQSVELDRLRHRLDLHDQLDAARIAPPVWTMKSSKDGAHRAIPSLVVTDWHRGEVVKPEQVDGLNKYNVRIADQRMRRAFENTVRVCRDYIKGMTYDGIVLFVGGDMISGSIHEELRETNEETVAESVVGMAEPLEAGINLLAKEFGKVHVACVVGNHSRQTRKPIAKNRVQDSMDWLIYKMVQRSMTGRADVTVQIPDAADCLVPVYNTKYLLTHGDQFRGGGGIAGVLSPLLLGSHRKTRRAATAGRPYDVMVFGHFHQSLWFPSKGLIGSGCGVGYNEYAYVNNFEPEPAQCAMWLTTPEKGITISAPIFVSDRKSEGW